MLMFMFQRRKGASWITKMRSVFFGYKYGMKGYKIWNPITKKTVYSRDVVFQEVKEVPRQEVNPMEKELQEKIEFKLEGEESDSREEVESEEEEPHTPVLRRSSQERRKPERYSPPDFRSHFSMSINLLMMILEM